MFTRTTFAHSIGGLESHIKMISEALVKKGHSVFIITTQHPKGIEKDEINGVKLFYIKNTNPGKYSISWWQKSPEKFIELHNQEKFDIVHSQGVGGYSFLKKRLHQRCNIPAVISMHGTAIDEIKSRFRLKLNIKVILSLLYLSYAYIFRDLVSLKLAGGVIATSNEQKKILKKFYALNEDKLHLVYNGIDTDLLRPGVDVSLLRRKFNLADNDRVILSLARIKEEKGIQNTILALPDILKKFPETKLLVVGEGEYKTILQELVKKLGVEKNVIFETFISYEELPKYYNLADIFVNSTIRENGYDLTLIQAMACSTVVISSNLGSVPTVIKDGENGILVPKGNVHSLSESIIRIWQDSELRKKIEEEGRKTAVRKFSLESMAEGTIKVYEKVLGIGN